MPVITRSVPPAEVRGKQPYQSQISSALFMPRSQSPASELETDFEDDSDGLEEIYSQKSSFESDDSRRRSQTTLSSLNEVPTPDPVGSDENQFEIRFRPVEGPSGPHLFRFSSSSSDFDFKNVLQMSPIVGSQADAFKARRLEVDDGVTPVTATFLGGMSFESAFEQAFDNAPDDSEAHIRSWSTQEVIEWMYDAGLDYSIVEAFSHHDINGTVLLDLDFDDLKELDIPSFGKRHQLWTAICALRGDDESARMLQPAVSESSRPSTRSSRRSMSRSRNGYGEQDEPAQIKRSASSATGVRRGRKAPEDADEVLPAESISIVAIEQLLPKAHNCAKGENCSKWRKQQRQLQQLRDEHGIECFPSRGPSTQRSFLIAGNSRDAGTAQESLQIPNPHLLQPSVQECMDNLQIRPTSEAMPSVVASSDLFGPGQAPELVLRENTLSQLGTRDPQDNVKQFLKFQHMNSPTHAPALEYPLASPGLEMFPSKMTSAYPAAQDATAVPLVRPSTASPHEQLRTLPKLDIPRSTSAGPSVQQQNDRSSTAVRGMVTSPVAGPVYRLGTPASEVDVPYMSVPMVATPVARDLSQSVPPNMQFNQPVRLSSSHTRTSKSDWRRPSMTLPALKEGEVLNAQPPRKASNELSRAGSTAQRRRTLDPAKDEPETKHFGYGPECTHSGWMRKRKTKMLRHEWQDAHFRLKGTQLAMHENARMTSQAKETIDVDDYAVACSNLASNSKLSAAMKIFNIKADNDKAKDPTAFAFQLVPNVGDRKGVLSAATSGKTHHFAVKTKDERIDWMRELMLAKALRQKGKGYEVEVNGVVA